MALSERNSNAIYLIVWLGFPYVSIPYVRRRHEIGTLHWTLNKMIELLIDTLLAFSLFFDAGHLFHRAGAGGHCPHLRALHHRA